jgi:phosphonate metabolism protein (transferase hexapeptide repeat family)
MYEIELYPEHLKNRPAKRLGEDPTVHATSTIVRSRIGAWTDIGPHCQIVETEVGDYTYCASNVNVIYSEIGKFCSIASYVRINPGNHPTDRVTQHHMTYRRKQYGFGDSDEADFFDWRRSHRCTIGHDVWIGHGVTVMPGVTIGTGAVVGSGAVVTKDIGPYEIAVGVPARVIKTRFPEELIERLLSTEWWNWDRATLESRFEDLSDVEFFLDRYGR